MTSGENQKSALIVGASRGLGLGLSRELLERGWHVTATVRAAAAGGGLEAFHERLTMDSVDINDLASVDPFVERVKERVFDVVFINAGISGPGGGKTAAEVTAEEMTHVFMTNAISPVRLAYKLLPVVKPGTGILAFMTSLLGSVELGIDGGVPIYAASKAALNRLSRTFAAGAQDVTIINMHPGWVRTDMGGANADIDVATSCRGMVDVLVAQAGAGGQQFLDYKGGKLPW